jgi:hypothetical protein
MSSPSGAPLLPARTPHDSTVVTPVEPRHATPPDCAPPPAAAPTLGPHTGRASKRAAATIRAGSTAFHRNDPRARARAGSETARQRDSEPSMARDAATLTARRSVPRSSRCSSHSVAPIELLGLRDRPFPGAPNWIPRRYFEARSRSPDVELASHHPAAARYCRAGRARSTMSTRHSWPDTVRADHGPDAT